MPHQQKIVLFFISHIHYNLLQVFFSQLVSIIVELIIVFFRLPLVVYFVELFYVVELPLQLRLNCLLPVYFLPENTVNHSLDFLVRWQVQISHSEHWFPHWPIKVANLFVLLRLHKFIHSFPFVRI